jgi:hypothetical protein
VPYFRQAPVDGQQVLSVMLNIQIDPCDVAADQARSPGDVGFRAATWMTTTMRGDPPSCRCPRLAIGLPCRMTLPRERRDDSVFLVTINLHTVNMKFQASRCALSAEVNIFCILPEVIVFNSGHKFTTLSAA